MEQISREKFMSMTQDEQINYDFRQTTMNFTETTELGRYLEYRSDDCIDADRCSLIKEVYRTLWEECAVTCTGETMNSVQTTLNQVCCLYFQKEQNLNILKNLQNEHQLTFNFPDKSGKYIWSKKRCANLYQYGKDIFLSLLGKDADNFLSAAYTIGNFTVWPAGCNGPRGCGPVSDYWDLTLYRIYQWYKDNDELLRILKKFPSNRELSNLFQSGEIALFPEWLFTFGSWDNFVRANYMQDFVYTLNGKIVRPEDDDGPFGRPRELWKGHFSGKVLPDIPQCEEFFKNAAILIKKRSKRMVKALKEKRQKPQQ